MKILIIDDEIISRKVLLKQMEGIGDCTAVGSSTKGLELIMAQLKQQQPYDLITMDVSMPKLDGPQLLAKIREHEKQLKIKKKDQVKILMVTARMNMAAIKACVSLGCNGYLTKPVNRYQLLNSLGKMGFVKQAANKEEKKSRTDMVARIIKRFYQGKIQLPVQSKLVEDIRKLAGRKDSSIEEMAMLLEKDIFLSSKLISIANSSIYRGIEKADTLNKALVRLGLNASSILISSIAAKKMFISDNSKVNQFLEKL